LILTLSLSVNALADSTEEILVDAVYKLIHRVNYLERKLQELQSKCCCVNTGGTENTGTVCTRNDELQRGSQERKEQSEFCRVIIGTFRNREGAERFANRYRDKICACVKVKETVCRNWKCFVVFADVPREQYRKIKLLIPDAFISRTTLHLHTEEKQRFSTTTAATSVQN